MSLISCCLLLKPTARLSYLYVHQDKRGKRVEHEISVNLHGFQENIKSIHNNMSYEISVRHMILRTFCGIYHLPFQVK